MRKRKIMLTALISTLVVAIIVIAVGTCFAAEKQYTFYMVSHSGPADPYWACVHKGWMDAAKLLNVNAKFVAPAKYSIKEMIDIFESAIDARPDGIAISTTEPSAMDETLKRAIKMGIPLLNYDSRDKRGVIPYITYIGGDEWYNGHYVAVAALEKFTPKRVIIGWHEPGHAAHKVRSDAVKEVLDEKGIPYVDADITVNLATQMQVFHSVFAKYPDADAIYTMGPPGAIGAIKFIKEEGLEDKVKIFCQDFSPEVLDAIKEGIVVVAGSQQPYLQGYLSLTTLYTFLEYKQAPVAPVITSVRIIDKSNVKEIMELAKKHIAG